MNIEKRLSDLRQEKTRLFNNAILKWIETLKKCSKHQSKYSIYIPNSTLMYWKLRYKANNRRDLQNIFDSILKANKLRKIFKINLLSIKLKELWQEL